MLFKGLILLSAAGIKISRKAERIVKEKQSSVGDATKWTAAISSRTSGAE
jgi:hypothetical protein